MTKRPQAKIVRRYDEAIPGEWQVLKVDRYGTWIHAANDDLAAANEQMRILKAELGITEQKRIERRAIGRRTECLRRQQRVAERRKAVWP